MGFWSGLFGGKSEGLNQAINQFSGYSGFASGLGESNLRQGSKFWSDILSKNSGRIAQAIEPEISAQQKQVQQGEKTAAEFHNRGGGVNSSVQSALGEARGNITDLVGKLQTGAASSLTSSGSDLLSKAMESSGETAALSEQQLENWRNSILGGAITGGVAIGLGAAGKGAGLGTSFFSGGG